VIKLEYLAPATQYSAGGWTEVGLDYTASYYNKKKELKGVFKYFSEIPSYFNNLNQDLKKFLESDIVPSMQAPKQKITINNMNLRKGKITEDKKNVEV
jgi:hypothetical protein